MSQLEFGLECTRIDDGSITLRFTPTPPQEWTAKLKELINKKWNNQGSYYFAEKIKVAATEMLIEGMGESEFLKKGWAATLKQLVVDTNEWYQRKVDRDIKDAENRNQRLADFQREFDKI